MDEADLMALIARGENHKVEFKREMDLNSGQGKAEFVKDIVSLANSTTNVGYLLVGVDDSKVIVGVDKLEEERIQQIAHTYIAPAVSLECHCIPVAAPKLALVGVVEVRPFRRPHKVARAIERLDQDDVFVRRGSVVAKAAPEEIIRMAGETGQLPHHIQQVIDAAEAHVRLGSWRDAIKLYTQVIEEMPTADLFLARAKAYEAASDESRAAEKPADVPYIEWAAHRDDYALRQSALKDYSRAISLTSAFPIEKEARLRRLLLDFSHVNAQSRDDWLADLAWLKQNTEGREHGEILFPEHQVYYWRVGSEGLDQETVIALTRAIELGFAEAEVWFLRGQAHAATFNFGLALHDLDNAIAKTHRKDQRLVEYLVARAETLVAMRRYAEARKTLQQAADIDPDGPGMYLVLTRHSGEDYRIRHDLQGEFRSRHGEP